MITADSLPIAILYEYLWQKSLPFGKSKIPLVNKLINPLVRVIPQKNFRRGEKHDKQKTYEKNSTCCNECRSCYDQHAICSSGI